MKHGDFQLVPDDIIAETIASLLFEMRDLVKAMGCCTSLVASFIETLADENGDLLSEYKRDILIKEAHDTIDAIVANIRLLHDKPTIN